MRKLAIVTGVVAVLFGVATAVFAVVGIWTGDSRWTDTAVVTAMVAFFVGIGAAFATLGIEPFTLSLDQSGYFPRARGAWIGPSIVPPRLLELHARTISALGDHGFEFDARPFRPHLTLARACGAVPAWRGPAVTWRVEHAVLCRSEGTDAGVRYTVIARTAPASVR